MKLSDIFGMSLTNLWRRKTRTILTVLGVIIGTSSIVVMLSLGIGLKQAMMAEVGTAGGLTEIMVYSDGYGGSDELYLSDDTIENFLQLDHVESVEPQLIYTMPIQVDNYETEVDVYGVSQEYLEKISLGDGTLPEAGGSLQLLMGSQTVNDFMDIKTGSYTFFEEEEAPELDLLSAKVIAGVEEEDTYEETATEEVEVSYSETDDTFASAGYDFSAEEDFSAEDEATSSFGSDESEDSYDEDASDLTGTTVDSWSTGEDNYLSDWNDEDTSYTEFTSSTKKVPITICGVTAGGEDSYSETDYNCYADIDALKTFLKQNYSENSIIPGQPTDRNGKPYRDLKYSQLTVNVDDSSNVEELLSTIQNMGYYADANKEWLEETERQFMIIEAVLGGIGGVAMLVAAISIANTMTMSTYERTKEIGIMKVLGCSLSNIRSMFLAEAAFIGFLGGVTGVLLSFLLSFIVNQFAPSLMELDMEVSYGTQISQIPFWLVLLGIVFATLIGMVAGFFPAQRATKLSPLAAIRNE
jgi:ABC-type antimicrobial peptide transport system permease subunit